jgi:hypothetical protein
LRAAVTEFHWSLTSNTGPDCLTAAASTPIGLNTLDAVATWEREIMLERQREGIAKAKAEGKYKGRKPTVAVQADRIRAMRAAGEKPAHIARRLGVARSSVYRTLEGTLGTSGELPAAATAGAASCRAIWQCVAGRQQNVDAKIEGTILERLPAGEGMTEPLRPNWRAFLVRSRRTGGRRPRRERRPGRC